MRMPIVVLALFLFACSDTWGEHSGLPTSYTIQATEHLDAVTAAAAGWGAFGADSPLLTVSTDPGAITIHFVSAADVDSACGMEGLGGCTLARVDSAEIYIDENAPEALLPQIIAHELGHAMHLAHDGAGTVMYPYADGQQATAPTEEDFTRYRALR